MKALYVPVYRMAVSYSVKFGRRWSLLEHVLLINLCESRATVSELSQRADLPQRLIIEALINLLRAGWIEVLSKDDGASFTATPVGKVRAGDETLPAALQRKLKWISLCSERLTGSWLRSDDLQLVHEKDLPESAEPIEPIHSTYDMNDSRVRELLYLDNDESFEYYEPTFRPVTKLFARFEVAFDTPDVPPYAPLALRYELRERARSSGADIEDRAQAPAVARSEFDAFDTISDDDIIVGGAAHFDLIARCLSEAKSYCAIHSCFLDPGVVDRILPNLDDAAKRGVRVDLLWGLRSDPEQAKGQHPLVHSELVLKKLSEDVRNRVSLSPVSSASHAKTIIFDHERRRAWTTIVGSCNFLSSYYDLNEISLRTRSLRLASQVLGNLVSAQQPASGNWSAVAKRLNQTWQVVHQASNLTPDEGEHRLTLLVDDDHYACIRMARDWSQHRILLGCDLYGMAAETAVLVPMARAAELGRDVQLVYRRPSRFLQDEGHAPDHDVIGQRGIKIDRSETLHGKFLIWDQSAAAISSFNWLATVSGTRARGAEIGVLVNGGTIGDILEHKLGFRF